MIIIIIVIIMPIVRSDLNCLIVREGTLTLASEVGWSQSKYDERDGQGECSPTAILANAGSPRGV